MALLQLLAVASWASAAGASTAATGASAADFPADTPTTVPSLPSSLTWEKMWVFAVLPGKQAPTPPGPYVDAGYGDLNYKGAAPLGFLMGVRYNEASPLGVYDEVIYIAGQYQPACLPEPLYSTARIWVSDRGTQKAGRCIWGLTKVGWGVGARARAGAASPKCMQQTRPRLGHRPLAAGLAGPRAHTDTFAFARAPTLPPKHATANPNEIGTNAPQELANFQWAEGPGANPSWRSFKMIDPTGKTTFMGGHGGRGRGKGRHVCPAGPQPAGRSSARGKAHGALCTGPARLPRRGRVLRGA
jgi:hypothetical protein